MRKGRETSLFQTMIEYLIRTPDEETAKVVADTFKKRGFEVEILEPTLVRVVWVRRNYA